MSILYNDNEYQGDIVRYITHLVRRASEIVPGQVKDKYVSERNDSIQTYEQLAKWIVKNKEVSKKLMNNAKYQSVHAFFKKVLVNWPEKTQWTASKVDFVSTIRYLLEPGVTETPEHVTTRHFFPYNARKSDADLQKSYQNKLLKLYSNNKVKHKILSQKFLNNSYRKHLPKVKRHQDNVEARKRKRNEKKEKKGNVFNFSKPPNQQNLSVEKLNKLLQNLQRTIKDENIILGQFSKSNNNNRASNASSIDTSANSATSKRSNGLYNVRHVNTNNFLKHWYNFQHNKTVRDRYSKKYSHMVEIQAQLGGGDQIIPRDVNNFNRYIKQVKGKKEKINELKKIRTELSTLGAGQLLTLLAEVNDERVRRQIESDYTTQKHKENHVNLEFLEHTPSGQTTSLSGLTDLLNAESLLNFDVKNIPV